MAVLKPTSSNLFLLQLVMVIVIVVVIISSSSSSLLINGHQSPAATTHTSCRHHHHHHHHHDHHDHDDLDDVDLDDTVSISIKKRNLLPEELAEEEDLKLYGFRSHHHHPESESESESETMLSLTGAGLWIRAMGCSLLVSLASLICLTIIPILCAHGTPSKLLVDSLALFGAGAMLGDAFLHQLPHAFGGGHSHGHEDHDHSGTSHSHSLEDLSVGLSILFGIVVFLIVEKIVRFVEEFSGGEHSGSHTHHHHHHKSSKKLKKLKADEDSHKKSNGSTDDTLNSEQLSESKSDLRKRGKSGDKRDTNKKRGEIKSAIQPSNRVFGYLNLFSDAVHNFTDGIALGSAFLLYGSVGGWSRTLFLLAHEIPQEVGDFGILVRSGFSVSKALFFNFLSALVALAGTALALLLGQDPGQSSLIEGFTAGGFIYISVAGVLAEMNNSGSPSLKSSVSQLISLVSGMGVALGISLIE